jgi:hypothetical protein
MRKCFHRLCIILETGHGGGFGGVDVCEVGGGEAAVGVAFGGFVFGGDDIFAVVSRYM